MRSKIILFVITGLIVVSTLAFTACTAQADPTDTVAGQLDPKQVFAANCASCHGAHRLGTPDAPNIMKEVLVSYTDTSLASFIKGHNGQLLTASQAAAIATYLKTK